MLKGKPVTDSSKMADLVYLLLNDIRSDRKRLAIPAYYRLLNILRGWIHYLYRTHYKRVQYIEQDRFDFHVDRILLKLLRKGLTPHRTWGVFFEEQKAFGANDFDWLIQSKGIFWPCRPGNTAGTGRCLYHAYVKLTKGEPIDTPEEHQKRLKLCRNHISAKTEAAILETAEAAFQALHGGHLVKDADYGVDENGKVWQQVKRSSRKPGEARRTT
jgi:hypothetical protein